METIKVMIADDHTLFRQGLCRILELEEDIEVVAEASDGKQAVALAKERRPDVILMDINMPGMNGLEATRTVKEVVPESEIVILTIHADDEYIFEVLRAGARGYILKDVDASKLADAIRAVKRGEAYIPPALLGKVLKQFRRLAQGREEIAAAGWEVVAENTSDSSGYAIVPAASRKQADEKDPELLARLTTREKEILECIVDGQSNKEIADTLVISEKTVKNHVSNILRKLEVADRTQAAVYALRHGINGRS